MKHGVDCPCRECEAVRAFLVEKEKTGEIYIIGTTEDKKKIRQVKK